MTAAEMISRGSNIIARQYGSPLRRQSPRTDPPVPDPSPGGSSDPLAPAGRTPEASAAAFPRQTQNLTWSIHLSPQEGNPRVASAVPRELYPRHPSSGTKGIHLVSPVAGEAPGKPCEPRGKPLRAFPVWLG